MPGAAPKGFRGVEGRSGRGGYGSLAAGEFIGEAVVHIAVPGLVLANDQHDIARSSSDQ